MWRSSIEMSSRTARGALIRTAVPFEPFVCDFGEGLGVSADLPISRGVSLDFLVFNVGLESLRFGPCRFERQSGISAE